jgi:RecJ-like exonuclease
MSEVKKCPNCDGTGVMYNAVQEEECCCTCDGSGYVDVPLSKEERQFYRKGTVVEDELT